MADRLPIGPYREIPLKDGFKVPLYLLPFDKHGKSEAPLTRDCAIKALKSGQYTDLILFSHGWNNDWKTAVERYTHFLENYAKHRQAGWKYTRTFHPMLIGVIWPSAVLVMPDEEAPGMAADGDIEKQAQRMADEVEQERREVQEIADLIGVENRERFHSLVQREERLNQAETKELATILLPLYKTKEDEVPGPTPELTEDGLIELWAGLDQQQGGVKRNPAGGVAFVNDANAGPEAAGFKLPRIPTPRDIVRTLTVLMMKDRAGVVGANGVGELLRAALDADSELRVHLVGHSYGCKVVLSALCHKKPRRPVESILLLQPAISAYCFAAAVPDNGKPGGYREALNRVKQPILTTFSENDRSLTRLFHLAVRRKSDLGEMRIAGAETNKFRALGGFGPAGTDAEREVITIKAPVDEYNLTASSARILALEADGVITSHSDISNLATWWALFNQVKA